MILRPIVLLAFLVCLCAAPGRAEAQNVKRLVVVKIDGLPGYYVDKFVNEKDPETGRSVLPWIEKVFYQNGTRVPNFYTRGMSLSGPSWGQVDTGQHLQIKGNVEFDRYTLHAYDYLNFVPYYVAYGRGKKADMPATEVMDQLQIPLLCDAFPFARRYTAQQLYQRGNDWAVLANGFLGLYPGDPQEFIDEWTVGLNFRQMTINQVEQDVLKRIVTHPHLDYLDYYDTAFDHVSHHNNDTASKLTKLKHLDRLIGRFWNAIAASSRAGETALVLISDHGFNSDPKVYSQGFNLVKLLSSAAGGGHHVVTKRRLMLDYSIKGLYPFVPLIKSNSPDSYYLKGQSDQYPTAMLDFDGNERSSVHLRNSDLNILHILFQQIKEGKLSKDLDAAVRSAVFRVIDRNRGEWSATAVQLGEELQALRRKNEVELQAIAALPVESTDKLKLSRQEREANIRRISLAKISAEDLVDYDKYLSSLKTLLGLKREFFRGRDFRIEDLIAPGAMGESNTLNQLQNYVVGLSNSGLVIGPDDNIDLERSFTRLDYFDLVSSQRVRNNVQAGVGNRPVDFIASRVPISGFDKTDFGGLSNIDDPVWLYGGAEKQALILSKKEPSGLSYRYLPIRGLRHNDDASITYKIAEWSEGFPLRYFEDKALKVPGEKAPWLDQWHTEQDWFRAVHQTIYSNAIIGLNEQVDRHPVGLSSADARDPDAVLVQRFRDRQRRLTEADLLIVASNHWNFDVRGFNPGGNHGSYFRTSTNSTFMISGGNTTGLRRGAVVEEPYDNMSFVPTMLWMMGRVNEANQPTEELRQKGFKPFPGRVIKELIRTDPVLVP
jgi:hypothetical protein